jgi:DNA-binding GntR family transcriptional regulator
MGARLAETLDSAVPGCQRVSGNYVSRIGANPGTRVTPVGLGEPSVPETGGPQARITVAEIARRLRERVAGHALPPGARLREWDVATEFDVPRALELLVHLGFADRQPNRGIIVRRRQVSEILRLFDMREVNEGLCARIAASRTPPDSWQDLVGLFGAPMEAIVERKGLHAYVENDEELRRRRIAAASAARRRPSVRAAMP